MSKNTTMNKRGGGNHAFLVMAHGQQELLEALFHLLDHERNDIYLHVDAKWKNFDEASARRTLKKSKLTILEERRDLRWGEAGQVWVRIALLREALKTPHAYYHAVSGVDLPLRTPKEFFEFFEENSGKEFVGFSSNDYSKSKRCRQRYSVYHGFFGLPRKYFRCVNRAVEIVQDFLRIDRVRGRWFGRGEAWWSITHAMAEFTLSQENWLKKIFSHSYCGDEVFMQALIENSPYADKIFDHEDMTRGCMRLIDWERREGNSPWTFGYEDFEMLKNSNRLFARKFDIVRKPEIVRRWREHLSKRKAAENEC